MTLDEAIGIAVARTGHHPYRDYCDPTHPAYNPDYIPVVMRVAAEVDPGISPSSSPPPPDRPGVVEATALVLAARRCPFQSRDAGCGCQGVKCALRPRGSRPIAIQQCIDCLRRYPDPDPGP